MFSSTSFAVVHFATLVKASWQTVTIVPNAFLVRYVIPIVNRYVYLQKYVKSENMEKKYMKKFLEKFLDKDLVTKTSLKVP